MFKVFLEFRISFLMNSYLGEIVSWQCGTKEKHLILEEYIILFKCHVKIVRHDHAGRYMLCDFFLLLLFSLTVVLS